MSQNAFSSLPLPAAQLLNLSQLGYREMTAVQAAVLPFILAGQDVQVKARTGSGKTAAFGIALLDKLLPATSAVQAMVLCPTRELADQVSQELRRLARFQQNIKILTLCGGQPMGQQLDSLIHAPHIVVGTPGRIQEHLRKKTLQLGKLRLLVLDEADRMLDMGFHAAIDDVISYLPSERQTLLFSATWRAEIEKIGGSIQQHPLHIDLSDEDAAAIEQHFFETCNQQRLPLLVSLLGYYQPANCLVFCNTRLECQRVCDALNARGIAALALHGSLEQRERSEVLVKFSNGSARVLVASDVAARGLDIKELAMVINYELAWDVQTHIHRIGRTNRAGAQGLAVSLCSAAEMQRAHDIEDYLKMTLSWQATAKIVNTGNAMPESDRVTIRIEGGRQAKRRIQIISATLGHNGEVKVSC